MGGIDPGRQGEDSGCVIDRDRPLIPGDVPVELDVVRVEQEGTGDGVGYGVGVIAGDRQVGVADSDVDRTPA